MIHPHLTAAPPFEPHRLAASGGAGSATAKFNAGEERYRALFEAAPIALFACDRDAIIRDYNAWAVELWGRAPVCGVEKHCGSLRLFLPDGSWLPHDQSPMMEVLRTGHSVRNIEVLIERPDGSRLPVLVHFAALKDSQGEVTGVVTSFSDLTVRKAAEDRLRESELRYRTLFDSMSEGFCIAEILFDDHGQAQDSRFLEVNSAFEEQSGLRNAAGRTIRELASGHEQHWFEVYGRVALSGEPVRFEAQAGALARWFEVSAFRIGQPEQRRIAILFKDISARKEAEVRWRENEGFLQSVIGASVDSLKVIDSEGRLTWMSPNGLCAMDVLDFEAIRNSDWLAFWADESTRLQAATAIRAARAGGVGRFRGFRPTMAGRPKWWDVVVSPIGDQEDKTGDLLCISRDVTEQRAAEEALRLSEERYRALVHATTNTVWRMSGDGKAMLGLRGDTISSHVDADAADDGWLASCLPAAEQPHQREAWERAVAQGRFYEHEHSSRAADGEIHHWISRAVPMRDAQGGIREWVGASTNITARKRAEEELRRTLDQLEERIAGRTAELELSNQLLRAEIEERKKTEQERQQLLEKLTGAEEEERRRISRELHDQVGQELTVLMLGLNTLQARTPGPSAAMLRDLAAIVEKIGKDIHDLALELRPTALDDVGLAAALASYLEQWSSRSHVPVAFHCGTLDAARLPAPLETIIYRLVQEAMTNVLKHAQPRQASVVVERREDHVLVIVEDDGVGFDAEHATKAARGGRLGLLGLHERAAMCGGTVQIESIEGRGTTVYARLPLSRNDAVAGGPACPQAADVRANVPKRVGDNAFHLTELPVTDPEGTSTALPRVRQNGGAHA